MCVANAILKRPRYKRRRAGEIQFSLEKRNLNIKVKLNFNTIKSDEDCSLKTNLKK